MCGISGFADTHTFFCTDDRTRISAAMAETLAGAPALAGQAGGLCDDNVVLEHLSDDLKQASHLETRAETEGLRACERGPSALDVCDHLLSRGLRGRS
jgi:hypothetical protein